MFIVPTCTTCCIILFPIQASQKEMGLGFPCRSYDHLFLYIQCQQTMTLIIWTDIQLSLLLVSWHLFPSPRSSEGMDWCILFPGLLIPPGCGLRRLGGSGTQTSSSLLRHALHSLLTTWPDPGLFGPLQPEDCSLMEEAAAHEEGVRNLFLTVIASTSVFISEFMEIILQSLSLIPDFCKK